MITPARLSLDTSRLWCGKGEPRWSPETPLVEEIELEVWGDLSGESSQYRVRERREPHTELCPLKCEAEYDPHVCGLMMGEKKDHLKGVVGMVTGTHVWPGTVFTHQLERKIS